MMKLKLSTASLALLASFCVSHSAFAYVATTGTDLAMNDNDGSLAIGTEYSVKGGDFSSYVQGTDGPTLMGDLSSYRYKADGTITAVDPATDTATFTGTYRIFFDANGNGKYNPAEGDTSVSFGSVALTITLEPTGAGIFSGTLDQTKGPSNGDAGFSSPASLTGAFQVVDDNKDAAFTATLSSVPEPSTWMAALSGGGLLLGAMRLRKRA